MKKKPIIFSIEPLRFRYYSGRGKYNRYHKEDEELKEKIRKLDEEFEKEQLCQ